MFDFQKAHDRYVVAGIKTQQTHKMSDNILAVATKRSLMSLDVFV